MDQVAEGTPLGKPSQELPQAVNVDERLIARSPVLTEALTQSFVMILVSEIGTSFCIMVRRTLKVKG